MLRPLLLAALLATPLALAQEGTGVEATILVPASGTPAYAGPPGVVAFQNATPGAWMQWRVASPQEHLIVEIRVTGAFDVERPRQVVPLLRLDPGEAVCQDPATRGACEYPLFFPFAHERIWEADSPDRLFHVSGQADDLVLRLGIPGPVNATLALQRDVTPPAVAPGAPQDVTHRGFFVETRTDELAIVDLQVRRVGAEEWIPSPTPEHHVLQRFPIQGLQADAEHEYRFVARDWAGNEATLGPFRVRTAPVPSVPKPLVLIVEPAENATVPAGQPVVIRARIDSLASPVAPEGVVVFLDKKPITEGVEVANGEVRFTPPSPLAPGRHSVAVEATNAAGGKGIARWSFDVEGTREAPLPALAVVLVLLAALALRRR